MHVWDQVVRRAHLGRQVPTCTRTIALWQPGGERAYCTFWGHLGEGPHLQLPTAPG